MIWSDSYLNALLDEAELDIVTRVDCIYKRYAIGTTVGLSLYTLPTDFRSLIRISWKGKKLDRLSFRESMIDFPNSAYVSSGVRNEYPQGIPRFYCFHPQGSKNIKLFPTPSEALPSTGDVYGSGIRDRLIISYWGTGDLPDYIARRTKKAYAMWQAFLKEGKGQNKQAAKYFKTRYEFLIDMFNKINSNVYLSRESTYEQDNKRRRDPILPSNYEFVRYR